MKKLDYIKMVSTVSEVTQNDVRKVLDAIKVVVDSQIGADDEGIPVIDGVKLMAVRRASRNARNPQTGEAMLVPEKYLPKAKFTPTFKKVVADKFA